ncbi:MAG: hypothetical protein V1696_01975, partial [Candidatus Jorgensenbacteria bacterium]
MFSRDKTVWFAVAAMAALALCSVPSALAFSGPTAPAGSGGGLFSIDASQNIGFGTAAPAPVGTFDDASSSLSHGYIFAIASTTNPGLSLKNLTSGFSYLWSSKNDGSFQLYREKYSDIGSFPGKVMMVVTPYGNVGFPGNAYSYFYPTERLEVGGNIKASAFGLSAAGNVIANAAGSGACMGSSGKGNLIAVGSSGSCNVQGEGNVAAIGGAFIGSGASLTGIFPSSTSGGAFTSANYAFPLKLAVGTSTTMNLPAELYVVGQAQTTATTTLATSGGNVGIGTTTPTSMLHILGVNRAAGLTVRTDTAGNGAIIDIGLSGSYGGNLYYNTGTKSLSLSTTGGPGNDAAGYLTFGTGLNAERMRITSDGNVGIGTSTPAYKLDVWGTGRFTGQLTVPTPTADTSAATKGYVDSVVGGGSGAGSFTTLTSSATTTLATAGGNVGIGTTSPVYTLDVVGAASPFRVKSTTAAASEIASFKADDDGYVAQINKDDSDNALFRLYDGSGTIQTLLTGSGSNYINSGNVGIGTTGPAAKLEVVGAIRGQANSIFHLGDVTPVTVGTALTVQSNLNGLGLTT